MSKTSTGLSGGPYSRGRTRLGGGGQTISGGRTSSEGELRRYVRYAGMGIGQTQGIKQARVEWTIGGTWICSLFPDTTTECGQTETILTKYAYESLTVLLISICTALEGCVSFGVQYLINVENNIQQKELHHL